jgi:hypothetical protein
VFNFIDVMSTIGGLGTSLLAAAGVIGGIYNSYVYAVHFVHLLYFVREFEKVEDAPPLPANHDCDDQDKPRLETSNKLLMTE